MMRNQSRTTREDLVNDLKAAGTIVTKKTIGNTLRREPGQYLDGRPPEKTRLLLEEVLVRPAGGAHPVVCVGPNAPV